MTETKDDQDTGLNPVAIIEAVVPEGWKSKLRNVAVQLGIGTQKGARLYAAGRDQIDTSEGKSIVSKALAEAVAREAVNSPEMMGRARARFLSEFGAKQENLEAVVIGAANHLHADTAPEPLLLTSGVSSEGDQDAAPDPAENAAPLNGDWAAAFTREAEGATSDELRDRLARVLAGEIRNPGMYPRGVLRQIAELDRADIEAMTASMPFRVGSAIFNLSSEESGRIGRLLNLADAGLVVDATSGLTRLFNFEAENGLFVSATFGRQYGIVLRKADGVQLQRPFAPLNRTGQSVADLLDESLDQERQVLRALGKTFENEVLEILLVKMTGRIGDRVTFTTIEYLKTHQFTTVAPVAGNPFTPKFPQ